MPVEELATRRTSGDIESFDSAAVYLPPHRFAGRERVPYFPNARYTSALNAGVMRPRSFWVCSIMT
jgi:hypothetical protein